MRVYSKRQGSLLRPLYCLVADGGGVTAVFPPMPMSLLSVPGAAVDCDSTCFGMMDLAVDLAGQLRGIQLFLGHTRLENHRFVILGLRWTTPCNFPRKLNDENDHRLPSRWSRLPNAVFARNQAGPLAPAMQTLACLAALTPDRENRQHELVPASLCSILMCYSSICGSTSLAKFRSDSCQPR